MLLYYIKAKGEMSVIFSVSQHIFIIGFTIESFLQNFSKTFISLSHPLSLSLSSLYLRCLSYLLLGIVKVFTNT